MSPWLLSSTYSRLNEMMSVGYHLMATGGNRRLMLSQVACQPVQQFRGVKLERLVAIALCTTGKATEATEAVTRFDREAG